MIACCSCRVKVADEIVLKIERVKEALLRDTSLESETSQGPKKRKRQSEGDKKSKKEKI